MGNTTKPQNGQLLYLMPFGAAARVLASGKPFAILQQLKKEYIMRGYDRARLKITY